MKKRNLFIVLGIIILAAILYFSDIEKFLTTSLISPDTKVVMETNLGDITIKLLPEEVPNIAENFAQLVQENKYDGTIFHRVIEGFMIQGGDYENHNGTGGMSAKGELLEDEFSPNLSHVRGAVSMANRGPNTNGSQFFIVQQDAPFLDGRHAIFGQVVDGMDTVDRIAAVNTGPNDMPLEKVTILDAHLSN
ncbi:peptidylprolyl isomerase [Candidatus Gracilibacteria bacterium]|nr:peptidylprolyl isomerase [Candidatus Gracilibacteria bacterium]